MSSFRLEITVRLRIEGRSQNGKKQLYINIGSQIIRHPVSELTKKQ